MSTSAAVRAAVSFAASHGVVSTEPVVMKAGSNVIVHLRPAPVVARVASRTALVRPSVSSHFARDLAVSAFLDSRGVPVVTPSAELPAGPHTHDGFVLAFSTYVPHDPSVELSRPDVLKMLPDLHAELRLYEGDLPSRGPLDDTDNTLAYLSAQGVPELEPFCVRRDELLALWDAHYHDVQPLHGDPHYGNLLMTSAGPVWNDFEDTWRGPVAWDLACLAGAAGAEAAQRAAEIQCQELYGRVASARTGHERRFCGPEVHKSAVHGPRDSRGPDMQPRGKTRNRPGNPKFLALAVEIYGGGAAPQDVEFHVEVRILFGTLWGLLIENS